MLIEKKGIEKLGIARVNQDPVDAMKVRRETTARAGKGMTEGNDRTWRDPAN